MAMTGAPPHPDYCFPEADLDVEPNCGIKWLPTECLGGNDTAPLLLELAGCGEVESRPSVCTALEK